MKKLFVVLACAGALALVGCGDKETPETFGKKYIEKKFENINCDLVDLDYTITEEGDDAATVVIEGKINYKEEVQLIKKDGAWVVGKKSTEKTAEKAAAPTAETKKAAPAKAEAKH